MRERERGMRERERERDLEERDREFKRLTTQAVGRAIRGGSFDVQTGVSPSLATQARERERGRGLRRHVLSVCGSFYGLL